MLDDPRYSQNLAYFCLFPDVKKELRELRDHQFETSLELCNKSREVISSFSEDWFMIKFDQWVHRHRKCVTTDGDYIEKVNKY